MPDLVLQQACNRVQCFSALAPSSCGRLIHAQESVQIVVIPGIRWGWAEGAPQARRGSAHTESTPPGAREKLPVAYALVLHYRR